MDNQLKKIGIWPINRAGQQELANSLIYPVIEGEVNPIEHIAKMKGLYEALKKAIDDDRVKDAVITETEKYGKKASWNGCEVSLKEVGVSYDFNSCNDPEYIRLIKAKADIDSQIKQRESYLKTVPDGTTILDEETGEVYSIHPAIRMAKQGYTITFSK